MSTENPLVSIIIPTYNRAHLIGETLDSVLAQTYPNWECIVVDDGSTDNTDALMADYMARDTRFRYYHRPKDRLPGGNAARNYGFEVSKGEFIQWFDSDDLMVPEKLEIKVKSILINKVDFVVCEGGKLIERKNMTYIKKWKLFYTDQALLEHIKGNLIFGTNGPLFNREYLRSRKLFDEQLIISQEWEFFSRLLMTEPNIILINKVLYVYRNEEDGKRKKITKKKFVNKIKALTKVVTCYKRHKFADKQRDFEVRKYLFLYSKLNFKRSLKNSYFIEAIPLTGLMITILNLNFLKESITRVLKNPSILSRRLKKL